MHRQSETRAGYYRRHPHIRSASPPTQANNATQLQSAQHAHTSHNRQPANPGAEGEGSIVRCLCWQHCWLLFYICTHAPKECFLNGFVDAILNIFLERRLPRMRSLCCLIGWGTVQGGCCIRRKSQDCKCKRQGQFRQELSLVVGV